jgi:hypothetical protein
MKDTAIILIIILNFHITIVLFGHEFFHKKQKKKKNKQFTICYL